MLILRIGLGLVLAYGALVVLAWLFQERLAFPAPRATVPDPRRVGVANGEKIELVTDDGTKLAGWYMAPVPVGAQHAAPLHPAPGLLWFYGNGENIATIWPILREFHPPPLARQPRQDQTGALPGAAVPRHRRQARPGPDGHAGRRRRARPGRGGTDPSFGPQRHLRRGRGKLSEEGGGVRQMTVTGTMQSRSASNRRSASSSARCTASCSASANLQLGATRPVSFRTATSARVTSHRPMSGSVWPATSSCSKRGRLRSSPSTYSDSRIFGPRNRRSSWSPRIRSNSETSTSARPL